MYPTGWKYTGEYNLGGNLEQTAAITEVATSLQAPADFIIPCEAASMCLFTFAADTNGGGLYWFIWGTISSSQGAAQESYYLNQELLVAPQHNNSTVKPSDSGFAFPGPGLPTMTEFSEFSGVLFQDSGVDTQSLEPISTVHWWNRIAGNQTIPGYMGHESGGSEEPSRSAASSDASDIWTYWGDGGQTGGENIADAGVAIIAVPCGPFQYFQIQLAQIGTTSNTGSLFYNLLV